MLSYTYDQSLNTLKQGRANYTTFNQAWLVQLGDAKTSKVASTVNYSMMPQGPAGRFPGVASHGWGIPVGSQNKDTRGLFLDGETNFVISGAWALQAYTEMFYFFGVTTWVETQQEFKALFPSYSERQRKRGYRLRKAI